MVVLIGSIVAWLVGGVDTLRGASHGAVHIAFVPRLHGLLLAKGIPQRGNQRAARQRGIRAAIPFDAQRLQPLLRGPVMVANHGHGIVDAKDVAHARHGARRGVIEAAQLAAQYRAGRDRRDLHAGQTDVDAEDRAAIDLARRVQPLHRLADDLPFGRRLQRHILRHRLPSGILDQRAVAEAAATRRMRHHAAPGGAFRGRYAPARRGGTDQHRPGRGTGLPQRRPGTADRGGASGGLRLQLRLPVEFLIGRCGFQLHLIKPDLQLLGQKGRLGGIDALPHLGIRHDQRDAPIRCDADETTGSEALKGIAGGAAADMTWPDWQ
jgi:hypothetical protein